MLREHDQVVLTASVSGDGNEVLQPGDAGTIIHIHPEGQALVVEFLSLDGETVAIATVLPSQIRPATGADLTHARIVKAAV